MSDPIRDKPIRVAIILLAVSFMVNLWAIHAVRTALQYSAPSDLQTPQEMIRLSGSMDVIKISNNALRPVCSIR